MNSFEGQNIEDNTSPDRIYENVIGPREVDLGGGAKLVAENIRHTGRNIYRVDYFIKNEEGTLLNLEDLLPDGVELEILFNDNTAENYEDAENFFVLSNQTDEKTQIFLGEYKGVDGFLYLLHELGHANDEKSITSELDSEVFSAMNNLKPSEFQIQQREKLAQEAIRSERFAWAYALKKLRKIEKDLGTKVLEKIGGITGLKAEIKPCLEAYHEHHKKQIEDAKSKTPDQLYLDAKREDLYDDIKDDIKAGLEVEFSEETLTNMLERQKKRLGILDE